MTKLAKELLKTQSCCNPFVYKDIPETKLVFLRTSLADTRNEILKQEKKKASAYIFT